VGYCSNYHGLKCSVFEKQRKKMDYKDELITKRQSVVADCLKGMELGVFLSVIPNPFFNNTKRKVRNL
jgi:hypothetical protein